MFISNSHWKFYPRCHDYIYILLFWILSIYQYNYSQNRLITSEITSSFHIISLEHILCRIVRCWVRNSRYFCRPDAVDRFDGFETVDPNLLLIRFVNVYQDGVCFTFVDITNEYHLVMSEWSNMLKDVCMSWYLLLLLWRYLF